MKALRRKLFPPGQKPIGKLFNSTDTSSTCILHTSMTHLHHPGSIGHLLELEEERKGFARYVRSQIVRFKEPVFRDGMMMATAKQEYYYQELLDEDDILSENISNAPRILKDLLDDDDEDLLHGLYNENYLPNRNTNSNTSNTPQGGCWTAFCFKWRRDH